MQTINRKFLCDELQKDIDDVKKRKILYFIMAILIGISTTCKNGLSILNLIGTAIIVLILYIIIYNFFISTPKTNLTLFEQNLFYIEKGTVRNIEHYGTRNKAYEKIIFTNNDSLKLDETEPIDEKRKLLLNSFYVGKEYFLIYVKEKNDGKLIKYYPLEEYSLSQISLNQDGQKIDGLEINWIQNLQFLAAVDFI